ncbi:MAG: hypothetical protein R3C97_05380 [Geminicoccaceae bacterium]
MSNLSRLIRQIDTQLEELERNYSHMEANAQASEAAKAKMATRIEDLKAERADIESQIPAEWEERHKAYLQLAGAESRARTQYRRAADGSYEGIAEVRRLLSQAGAVEAARADIEALRPLIEDGDAEAAQEAIKLVEEQLGALDDVSDIRSPLSKARRALKPGEEDRAEALAKLEESLAAHGEESAWRNAASAALGDALETYDLAIRDTFGLRQQPRLDEETAKAVAGCMAHHRDISLNF